MTTTQGLPLIVLILLWGAIETAKSAFEIWQNQRHSFLAIVIEAEPACIVTWKGGKVGNAKRMPCDEAETFWSNMPAEERGAFTRGSIIAYEVQPPDQTPFKRARFSRDDEAARILARGYHRVAYRQDPEQVRPDVVPVWGMHTLLVITMNALTLAALALWGAVAWVRRILWKVP